jgi:hypothetical protein
MELNGIRDFSEKERNRLSYTDRARACDKRILYLRSYVPRYRIIWRVAIDRVIWRDCTDVSHSPKIGINVSRRRVNPAGSTYRCSNRCCSMAQEPLSDNMDTALHRATRRPTDTEPAMVPVLVPEVVLVLAPAMALALVPAPAHMWLPPARQLAQGSARH